MAGSSRFRRHPIAVATLLVAGLAPVLRAASSDAAAADRAVATAVNASRPAPVDVVTDGVHDAVVSLNGNWTFKYVAGTDAGPDEHFSEPAYDVGGWKHIQVPGHWELQGFAEPRYEDNLEPGLGLYRRTFRVDPSWQGKRVFLRFEGVLYGFNVTVNGKPVGEWASSFNPATFDITDALTTGGDNVLAVRVTTRSRGWNFDNMDSWSLSGIYRDVELFALPPLHFCDTTEQTTLNADGSARLRVAVVASGAGTVAGRLVSPDGKPAGEFTVPVGADGRAATDVVVAQPQLWNAESPSLYRLELELRSGDGAVVQRYEDRIGLRQVTIEDGVLKLNGVPIKLRGVDHHEIWPEGQVSTEENTRRDLELMRAANINFIRTSHYPPHPRLLRMCDELGIYVDDEVPYIHGRKWLQDPSYQDVLLTRARATVTRDKNHACVIFWTCGNENPITALGNATAKYVKELDPTRPVTFPTIGSYFATHWKEFPDFLDLYASHYPSAKAAREFAKTLPHPVVFTEYAHQRGLARAGLAVQDLWEIFYHSPRIAGGAIWMFQDQGILRTTDDMNRVKDGDLMVWLDEHRYYDTHGFYAMDGIVYSDRTPQLDYWLVRKVYSPVQVKERMLTVKPGAQALSFDVENRHDFRSLAGMKLQWAVRRNGTALQQGVVALDAKPKQTQRVSLPVELPADLSTDVFTLELACVDEHGQSLYERSLQLDGGTADGARWSAVRAVLPAAEPTLDVSDATIVVRHPAFRLMLDRKSGHLELTGADGAVIASGFGPHVGRHPTINDLGKEREREASLWRGNLLVDATELKTDARQTADGIEMTVSGSYARPGKPDESIRGAYTLRIARTGAIDVSYDYAPVHATGEMLEAGFALAVPSQQSELRWVGQGPYAGYPGKDRQNESGVFHLNRDDLYFPGNRRGVELASLANPKGEGFLVATHGAIDLENTGATTIFSHLALVPGDTGNKDNEGEKVDFSSRLKASGVTRIAGRFTVLPLASRWPEPLTRWFGAADARVPVKHPFLRSYDQ